ncbi:MAG: hypothetical protein QOG64_1861 [Acidimicrobiaceae bacterium]|nr:hypothetical protein [Acidimicrobiaceae bacterium]
MQLRSKPIVFIAATALAAGIAVPSALALSGGGSRPTLPAQVSRTDDRAEHPTPEVEKPENEAEVETEKSAAPAPAPAPAPAVAPAAVLTNAPGATGDANRSAVAAEHSQASEHRATAPGQPAQQATATDDHPKGADDTTAETENEQENEQENEAIEVEHHGGDDSHSGDSSSSGSNSGRGSNSGHDSSGSSGGR